MHPEVPDHALALEVAEHPRAVHVVGRTLDDRTDERRHLLGLVLSVGVDRDHDVGAESKRDVVANAGERAAPSADRERCGEGATGPGGIGRAVLRVIVDHDRDDRVALDLLSASPR